MSPLQVIAAYLARQIREAQFEHAAAWRAGDLRAANDRLGALSEPSMAVITLAGRWPAENRTRLGNDQRARILENIANERKPT